VRVDHMENHRRREGGAGTEIKASANLNRATNGPATAEGIVHNQRYPVLFCQHFQFFESWDVILRGRKKMSRW
jgi:hypothetical protein